MGMNKAESPSPERCTRCGHDVARCRCGNDKSPPSALDRGVRDTRHRPCSDGDTKER